MGLEKMTHDKFPLYVLTARLLLAARPHLVGLRATWYNGTQTDQEMEAFYRAIAYGEPVETDIFLAAGSISTIYSEYLSADRKGAAVEVNTYR
jgi:hypothetical protein